MKTINIILAIILAFSHEISQSAVHLSSSKTGSAIIVPFYTASNQMNTLLSLNNTTNDNKAVKIHFKEAKSGDILTSFNVYLTGQDMWTMGMGQVPSTDGGRLRMISNDESCTVGFPNNQDIAIDEGWLWENGTIEIIEMGTVDPTEAPLVHRSCELINQMWEADQVWTADSEDQMSAATGGLHAEVTLMDVEQGHSANIPVIHLDGFYGEDNIQHTPAGDAIPNLSTGSKNSLVMHQGELIETTWPTGYEAVSALITQKNLVNEFNTEDEVAAKTEIIISFPTLHYHLRGNRAPFKTYSANSHSIWFPTLYTNTQYFNRSGEVNTHFPCGNCSPIPPEILSHSVSNFVIFRLPDEHTPGDIWILPHPILTRENSDHTGNTQYLLTQTIPYEPYTPWSYVSGKIRFKLSPDAYTSFQGISSHNTNINHTFHGMPVIGFAYTKFSNANAQPGLLAQYAFVRKHFGERKVEIIGN